MVKLFKKFMTFFLEEKEMSFSVFIFFLYAKSRPAQQMWGADEWTESVLFLSEYPVMPGAVGMILVLHWQPQGMWEINRTSIFKL